MKGRTAGSLATLPLALALCLLSCTQSTSTSPEPPPEEDPNLVWTTIAGLVLDELGNPVSGGRVSAHGRTTTTAENGEFHIYVQVPKDRCVVACAGLGYFATTRGEVPVANGITQFRLRIARNVTTHSFSGSTGGTASLASGSEVDIPPNALVQPDTTTYTGTISVALRHFDLTDPASGLAMPGSDLTALAGPDTTQLTGFGALAIQLRDGNGQELVLATGVQPTLAIAIAPTLVATAPSSVALWALDEATGLWVQVGTATRNGDRYEATVGHFSTWLCAEAATTRSTLCGRALDPNDVPVSSVIVRAGQWTAVTGPDGSFCLPIDPDRSLSTRVEPALNHGIASAAVTSGPWSGAGPHDIGVLRTDHIAHVSGALQCGTTGSVGAVYARDAASKVYAALTNAAGAFDLALPGNTPVTFLATSFSGSRSLESGLTSPPEDSTLTVGTLEVCSTNILVFITQPRNNSLSLTNVLNVVGSISVNTITTGTLSVNGQPQLFGISNRSYSSTAVLSPGVNTLRVRVVSPNGTVGANQIAVRFEGDLSPLTANLVWNTNQTDIDLHMINPSGSECYFASRQTGGMKLDVDDVTGFGPENISVISASSGEYRVRVRNYRNSVPTTATVRVYKGGTMIDQQVHTFGTTPMTFWDVGSYTLP